MLLLVYLKAAEPSIHTILLELLKDSFKLVIKVQTSLFFLQLRERLPGAKLPETRHTLHVTSAPISENS